MKLKQLTRNNVVKTLAVVALAGMFTAGARIRMHRNKWNECAIETLQRIHGVTQIQLNGSKIELPKRIIKFDKAKRRTFRSCKPPSEVIERCGPMPKGTNNC